MDLPVVVVPDLRGPSGTGAPPDGAPPDGAPPDGAVAWAARAASRRGVALRLVLPGAGTADRRRHALDEALAEAGRAAPQLPVVVVLTDDPPARTALAASAEAALLVLPGPAADVDHLVAGTHAPLVLVPRGRARTGPVLLAVGPATPDEAVAFAFAEAESCRAELVAVRAWHHPLVDLGVPTRGRIARWDAAGAAARDDLDERLGLARTAYPTVPVRLQAVDDSCTDLLLTVAPRARLLVLGTPARGSALGRLLPSPALALARSVPCPVAVVPPEGPGRPSLLPRRTVGLTDLQP